MNASRLLAGVTTYPQHSRAAGFSLLEALITMVVLIFGLMGMAKMTAVAVSTNHSAYLRSQAVLQAHNMADRMYANNPRIYNKNAADVHADNYAGISAPADTKPSPDCYAVSCTPAQIAAYDAWQWNTANALLLPSGEGSVVCPADPCAGLFTIRLDWKEIDPTNPDNATGLNTMSFSYEVKPLPEQPL